MGVSCLARTYPTDGKVHSRGYAYAPRPLPRVVPVVFGTNVVKKLFSRIDLLLIRGKAALKRQESKPQSVKVYATHHFTVPTCFSAI